MAMGTTRVYVHQPNGLSWDSYLEGLRAGRSFVTNGPLLDFRLIGPDGALRPGDVVAAGEVDFELDVYTATMVETVEILVNGQVMMAEAGPGTDAVGPLTTGRTFRGTLALPEGGWVAARAHGDSYPWAHTGPVWIGSVGSTEPAARRAAAADLLRALDAASVRLEAAYGAADIPRLRGHFERARTVLQEILQ